MKIDRLLSITLMLINRRSITARQLSEKYKVTLRTIYRDLKAIESAGIPVVAYQGKNGGFCLMDNYRIDRQLLTLNDITSILLALKGLNTSLQNYQVDETIEKVESLIPFEKKNYVQQQFQNVIIDLTGWMENPEQKPKVQIVNNAISESRLLSFYYCNLMGEKSDRCIEPMTLILKMHCWYVYGYCKIRDDFRLFRLSRISNCKVLSVKFLRKNKVYNESDFFKSANIKAIPIMLRFSPAVRNRVEEYFYNSIQSISDDGYTTVKIEYPEDEWVYSMLLSYGNDLEVISPVSLRKNITERLKKTIEYYKT